MGDPKQARQVSIAQVNSWLHEIAQLPIAESFDLFIVQADPTAHLAVIEVHLEASIHKPIIRANEVFGGGLASFRGNPHGTGRVKYGDTLLATKRDDSLKPTGPNLNRQRQRVFVDVHGRDAERLEVFFEANKRVHTAELAIPRRTPGDQPVQDERSPMRRSWKAFVWLFAFGLVGWVEYSSCMAATRPVHPFFAPRPGDHWPLVLAHQGGEGEWPSNTAMGFEESVRRRADVLDTDVHLTRDGQLVLIHDTTVDRTTNGKGTVADMTLAELEKLDAGYHFSSDGGKTYPFRGRGLRIPTLEWLLESFPEKRLVVEIKETPVAAVTELRRLLEKHHAWNRVIVGSFDPAMTYEVRRRCPGVATCATSSEARTFWVLSLLRLERLYSPGFESLQVPPEHEGRKVVTRRFVEAAHRRGIRVLPWTLDSEEEIRSAMDLGVDGINTNFPTRMLQMVQAPAEHEEPVPVR